MSRIEAPRDLEDIADELIRGATNFEVGSRLLFENERARFWDITLAPGERLPFHCHRTSYFYRCESPGLSRVRSPDGSVATYDSHLDEVTFHEIAPGEIVIHDLTNVADTVLRFTTVELLDGRRASRRALDIVRAARARSPFAQSNRRR